MTETHDVYLSGVRLPGNSRAWWTEGPWDDEPDILRWADERTGFPCIARRSRASFWCGYVGVGIEHPYYGLGYEDLEIDIHGGLSYAEACEESPEGVCHFSEDGEARWWFGFDCGHIFDAAPSWNIPDLTELGVYRDLAYVQAECSRLAMQLEKLP